MRCCGVDGARRGASSRLSLRKQRTLKTPIKCKDTPLARDGNRANIINLGVSVINSEKVHLNTTRVEMENVEHQVNERFVTTLVIKSLI